MSRRDVRVRGEPREQLDVQRFARALLGLAALLEAERAKTEAIGSTPANDDVEIKKVNVLAASEHGHEPEVDLVVEPKTSEPSLELEPTS